MRFAFRACCTASAAESRSEEHTSELQSRRDLVCRLLLEKKKRKLCRRSTPRAKGLEEEWLSRGQQILAPLVDFRRVIKLPHSMSYSHAVQDMNWASVRHS